MNNATYRISVEHNGRTNVVTREFHGAGDSWTPVGRYTTQSFQNPRKEKWEQQAQYLLGQHSALPYLPHEFISMDLSGTYPTFCMTCGEPERNDPAEGWCCGHHIYKRKEYSEQEIASWQKAMDSEPWAVESTFERYKQLAEDKQLTVELVEEPEIGVTLMFGNDPRIKHSQYGPAHFDLPQKSMSKEMWDSGMGCSRHRAMRSGSCHDCSMLQPETSEIVRDEIDQTMAMYREATGKP